MNEKLEDLVGKKVLFSRRFSRVIQEGRVNKISSTGAYIKINDDWFSNWEIEILDVLEEEAKPEEGALEHIYYWEKPVIGVCPKCNKFAIYIEGKGLICPECESRDISIFEWDGESKYPEEVD